MDALAAGLTRTGGDYQVSRADPPSLHRRCGLDCEQCRQKRFSETAAKLGEYVEEPTKLRGAIHLDRADPTGRQDRPIGPASANHLVLGRGQLLCQELHRPQHPC